MITRIDRIQLKNFRLFEHLDLDLHAQLTVLVAPNGSGKTAILQALTLALEPLTKTLADETWHGIQSSDVRSVVGPDQAMVHLLPTSVSASGQIQGKTAEWAIVRDSLKPRARGYRNEDAASLLVWADALYRAIVSYAKRERAEPPILPIIANYGTGRIWNAEQGKRLTAVKRDDTSRFRGYTGCLSPTANFGFFAQWFEQLTREHQQEQETGIPSPHQPSQRLASVREAVHLALAPTGWNNLSWGFFEKAVIAVHPQHGRMPVSQLSDGIKSILAMVADIAHRCARLNPQFGAEAAQKTPGIVLIDEVDMHLHPEWQQTILGSLRQAFPLIQFIITTHSPQVLTTVPAACIRILSVTPDGIGHVRTPDRQTQGVGSASVLAQIQGVSPVPPLSIARDLSTYTALIQQGQSESDEAKRLRTLLDAHFGADHPLILECDRLLRYQVFKVRLPSKGGA